MHHANHSVKIITVPLIVAALGYFVDIYDLLLFSIVRVPSLHGLGLSDVQITTSGMDIISYQMFGLLIGGILWGVLGDKYGRLSVLFGSIFLYSIANIANGLVETVSQYSWCRLIAGIGLAGELGVGITLISEITHKSKRGLATSLVAGIGITGAVLAYTMAQWFSWRVCYFIGGVLGLALLLLRVRVFESGLFSAMKNTGVACGNVWMFVNNWDRAKRYVLAILIGLPTWYVIGILITFSKEFAQHLGVVGSVDPAKAIMVAYIAIAIGDVLIGLLSQVLQSRKKALMIHYAIMIIGIILYFNQQNGSVTSMYVLCAFMGYGCGFWAIFVTMAAEQFGTNLRATAATTIPNMVRGSVPLLVLSLKYLQNYVSYLHAAAIVGVVVVTIASIAVFLIPESFSKDLDFNEI